MQEQERTAAELAAKQKAKDDERKHQEVPLLHSLLRRLGKAHEKPAQPVRIFT